MSLSFYAVTGAVVAEVLRRLGHSVKVRVGPHEKMFPMLAAGEIDLMAAAWLPEGHAQYWSQYGDAATQVATLYGDARFFWAVPSYVPADEVASIADLAKPSVASRMTRNIQGIGAGAAISRLSEQVLDLYQLRASGYSFRPGSQSDWISAYKQAVAERRWVIFPTWAPQYLNEGQLLRPLADPKRTLGGANNAVLVAPTEKFNDLPARTRLVLSRIEIGIDGVTAMDRMVNAEGLTPEDSARLWLGLNDQKVNSWFEA
ncbi:glycine/betaine ABC transporter substrate-binding protein [Rhizobium lentis]|uniref:Glycine/betaine ABC transporter substrate-binding protein n=1 Tax=Rhizobium lentis TaxID=1138194 RepID=A0ABS7I956_9HYPH|nr:glycine/betaine ABC transporter substrate-binding protein [Rhizobium lentis]